jgi:uncharacterized OB-fold protein
MRVFVCDRCGRAVFPRRLLCPQCGAREWRDQTIATGVLEHASDRPGVRLGAVRTPLGPIAIARVDGDARPGAEVSLAEDGDIPVAGP